MLVLVLVPVPVPVRKGDEANEQNRDRWQLQQPQGLLHPFPHE